MPNSTAILDPMVFAKLGWPHVNFYKEQQAIMQSLMDNEETFVPAGNGLGKDFVSAFIALWWMCSRRPARCVTTSVTSYQLDDVLWGEIRWFIRECRVTLPLQYNHAKIRQINNKGEFIPKCELVAQVAQKGEGLLGRHLDKDIPRTLVIFDEASGIDDVTYNSVETWAHRKLVIGNTWPCTNFFKAGVQAGDLKSPTGKHLRRKVIRIKAEDSPNVRLAFSQIEKGQEPDDKCIIPGVVRYTDYITRRQLWDPIMQCVGLDADWYTGGDVLLYPPEWLNRAERLAVSHRGKARRAKTIGVDSAMGGDNTSWVAIDEFGPIEMVSKKTPDTSVIPGNTLAFMQRHGVKAKDVYFDMGGGGKPHADRLRKKGYGVQIVAFGGSATNQKRRGITTLDQRLKQDESRYSYKNRRSEMYGMLRLLLDPAEEHQFGLDTEITHKKRPDGGPSLRSQLAPIPYMFDGEGRLMLPPKQKKPRQEGKEDPTITMADLVGCSPDEADALVLAVFGMCRKPTRATAGVGF